MSNPSGNYGDWKAGAIGTNNQDAQAMNQYYLGRA